MESKCIDLINQNKTSEFSGNINRLLNIYGKYNKQLNNSGIGYSIRSKTVDMFKNIIEVSKNERILISSKNIIFGFVRSALNDNDGDELKAFLNLVSRLNSLSIDNDFENLTDSIRNSMLYHIKELMRSPIGKSTPMIEEILFDHFLIMMNFACDKNKKDECDLYINYIIDILRFTSRLKCESRISTHKGEITEEQNAFIQHIFAYFETMSFGFLAIMFDKNNEVLSQELVEYYSSKSDDLLTAIKNNACEAMLYNDLFTLIDTTNRRDQAKIEISVPSDKINNFYESIIKEKTGSSVLSMGNK